MCCRGLRLRSLAWINTMDAQRNRLAAEHRVDDAARAALFRSSAVAVARAVCGSDACVQLSHAALRLRLRVRGTHRQQTQNGIQFATAGLSRKNSVLCCRNSLQFCASRSGWVCFDSSVGLLCATCSFVLCRLNWNFSWELWNKFGEIVTKISRKSCPRCTDTSQLIHTLGESVNVKCKQANTKQNKRFPASAFCRWHICNAHCNEIIVQREHTANRKQ